MSNAQYQQVLDWGYHLGVQIEGNIDGFYLDSNNIATTSVGVAGVVLGTGRTWVAKPDLVNKLENAGVKLSALDKQDIKSAMTTNANELNKPAPDTTAIKNAINSISDITLSSAQSKALFSQEYKEHFAQIRSAIGPNVFDALAPERQGALAMQTYQTPARMIAEAKKFTAELSAKNYEAAAQLIEKVGKMDPSRAQPLAATMRDPNLTGKGLVTQEDNGLIQFAQRYNVSLDAVLKVNPSIKNVNAVRAGTVLDLPAGAIQMADVYKAYTGQGIAKIEADEHWQALGNHPTLSARNALYGLTPREAEAIMKTAQAQDIRGQRFSGTEMIAGTRYAQEMKRSGDPEKAMDKARSGLAEARMYAGPSREFSPEDTLTPSQNRAQLAMNTKVLEARRASLLDGGTARSGVGAAPAAPAASATRARAQKLYEQKVASLHSDPVAARRAVRTTLPEQVSLPNFSNLFNNAVDGLQSVLGVKTAAAKAPAIARGQLESAKIAGLVMDQPMADKVMTSKAYRTKTDPLNGFATKATQSFYGAAYADRMLIA